MEEEVSKKRRELILFIFSAVIFGFVLSILFMGFALFYTKLVIALKHAHYIVICLNPARIFLI